MISRVLIVFTNIFFYLTLFVSNLELNHVCHPSSDSGLDNTCESEKQYNGLDTLTPNYYATMTYRDGYALIPDYLYFWNLNSNYATNSDGCCTWVAVEIFLSYFDTIKNGNVIPNNNYIVETQLSNGETPTTTSSESPGIHQHACNEPYSGFESFHQDIVDEYSLYNSIDYPSLSYNASFLFAHSQQANLLNAYMENVLTSNELSYFWVDYWYSSLNASYVFNGIIDQLHAGRPVIANTPQHSFVVYGYVPNSQTLVIHNGHHNLLPHTTLDCSSLGYGTSIEMCVIADFNCNHTQHSYFYHKGNDAYCFCGDEIGLVPYAHYHDYVLNMINHHPIYMCSICNKVGGFL